MSVILTPVIETRVNLRRFNNFGKDDPLLWPQVFNRQVAHLAVIPTPYSLPTPELASAWYIPKNADFIIEEYDSIEGLKTFSSTLVASMESMSALLEAQVAKLADDERQGLTLILFTTLLSLRERLPLPATEKRLILLVSYFQRVCLELYARIQWICKWRVRERGTGTYEVDGTVMGAFTDDLTNANYLYRLGIPVWLVRNIEGIESTRVDEAVPPLDSSGRFLPVRGTNMTIDISQEEPPHPTVYTGLAGSFYRYFRMGRYLQSQFETNILGNFRDARIPMASSSPPTASSSAIRQSNPSPVSPPAAAVAKGPKTLIYDLERLNPRSNDTPAIACRASASTDPGYNKFQELQSPDMPGSLAPWRAAHASLAEFWRHLQIPGLNYVVPEVTVFFDPQRRLRVPLLLMWLRIRPVILWRLGSTGADQVPLYPTSYWRALLKGPDGNADNSKKGKRRRIMSDHIDDLVMQARKNGVNISNISQSTPMWNRQVLTASGVTSTIAQQILWELSEIGFRYELLALDLRLTSRPKLNEDDASLWESGQTIVNRCWPGFIFQPSPQSPGISQSGDVGSRQPYLNRLYVLMQSWRVEKPHEMKRAFPDRGNIDPGQYEYQIFFLEQTMATFYTRNFLKEFQRPATIPRLVSSR